MATTVKCSIASMEGGAGAPVDALLNPRELALDKQVPWNEHKTSRGDRPRLEFTDAAPAILSVELLFDTFETGGDVYKDHIARLERLTQVMDPTSSEPDRKRPPICIFRWGSFPPFQGVIEQLAVKYTMFFPDGTPCRATATVRMKESAGHRVGAGERGGGPGREEGEMVGQGDARRADRFGDDHRGALARNGSEDGRLRPGAPVPGRQGRA
jgi:hypothetical protein